MAHDNGIMQSMDISTGKLLSRQRTGTKTRIYANPLLVNNKIYVPLQDEGVLILEADAKMKEICRNRITQDSGPWHSSIAANGDRLFIRTGTYLYCLGPQTGPAQFVPHDVVDDQSDLIEPIPRIDFVAQTNRLQPYCYYLVPDQESVSALLLAPYKSVITEEQTNRSKEIVKENFVRFEELRHEQNNAFFEFMKGDLDQSGLLLRLTKLDADTIKQGAQVRVLIKKLFSAEQMEQHLKEAEEWKKKQAEQQSAINSQKK